MLGSMLCTDDDLLVALVACSTIPLAATIATPAPSDNKVDMPAAETAMSPCAFAESAPTRDPVHDGASTANRTMVPTANTTSTRDAGSDDFPYSA